jgi:hypothetical protein
VESSSRGCSQYHRKAPRSVARSVDHVLMSIILCQESQQAYHHSDTGLQGHIRRAVERESRLKPCLLPPSTFLLVSFLRSPSWLENIGSHMINRNRQDLVTGVAEPTYCTELDVETLVKTLGLELDVLNQQKLDAFRGLRRCREA